MALPPEKISVKRRRDEAPIETFYLEEHARAKRRITTNTKQAFQFTRIRAGAIAPISQQQPSTSRSVSTPPITSTLHDIGIPPIRTTAPGDEIADFAKLRQEQTHPAQINDSPASQQQPEQQPYSPPELPLSGARRFHLTRDLSSTYRRNPLSPSGAGRATSVSTIRPPLPTFIERQQLDGTLQQDNDGQTTSRPPSQGQIDEKSTSTEANPTSTSNKNGVSLRDPSSSWNLNSDSLADELAALAMDLDPDLKSAATEQEVSAPPQQPSKPAVSDDDFIYETYMRMPYDSEMHEVDRGRHDANVGVLVIEEADEDLWQEYMESDEDSDWDEEDSNAEDNPANDYPDDDLSSDDEYDRNAYRYHRGDDDDEYGDDDDDDDD